MELKVTLSPAGAAGDAHAQVDTPVLRGYLDAVYYRYAFSPASTTIALVENGGAGRTFLAVPAGQTDGGGPLRLQALDPTAAPIEGAYVRPFITGHSIRVTVEHSDPEAVIDVVLLISEGYLE